MALGCPCSSCSAFKSRISSKKPAACAPNSIYNFMDDFYDSPTKIPSNEEQKIMAFLDRTKESVVDWRFPVMRSSSWIQRANEFDYSMPPGGTLLHFAVKCQLLNLAAWLLSKGIDADVGDHIKNTALMISCQFGCENEEMVDLLLKYGANPNIFNRFGNLPIHFTRSAKVLELLIEYKGIFNHPSSANMTPLRRAYIMNNKEMIAVLEKAGACLEYCSTSGFTDVHLCSKNNQTRAVTVMLHANFDELIEERSKKQRIH